MEHDKNMKIFLKLQKYPTLQKKKKKETKTLFFETISKSSVYTLGLNHNLLEQANAPWI
jgi:hypothetical protein